MKRILCAAACLCLLLLCACTGAQDTVLGKLSKNKYQNTPLSISFELKDGWSFAADSDRLSVMGLNPEEFENEKEIDSVLLVLDSFIPFMASNKETGSNIILQIDKALDTDDCTDFLTKKRDNFAANGSYTQLELSETEICGVKYAVLKTAFSYYDYDFTQNYYTRYVKCDEGEYFVTYITLLGLGDTSDMSSILEQIKK